MSAATPSLAVDLGGVRFPRPVLAAAGCLGDGKEGTGAIDASTLGGIVTRTISYAPSLGGPTPRLAQTPSGLLTNTQLQNPGVRAFRREHLPVLASHGVPIVVSIGGATTDEFIRVAHEMHDAPGVVALEVYLPSPDVERGGSFASRVDRCTEVIGAVSRLTRYPVFAKLPLLEPDLVEAATACLRAGAHGLTLIDSIPGYAVDLASMRQALGTGIGYLSGPALRPIAVGAVRRVAAALPEARILGVGGVMTGGDAAEFLLAGASAVQIGTALLVDPGAPARICSELSTYLARRGMRSVTDLRGRVGDAGTSTGGGVGSGGPAGAPPGSRR